mmetsp:Transcript_5929/g.16099  ORF Transcript_5929/g.16099 Transcript_5929/m.16099 type:complete len:175 (-) Transcript_5929:518-1042(-)
MSTRIHAARLQAASNGSCRCPVCLQDDPKDKSMAWHTTATCSHRVCMGCFQGYARNQLNDASFQGDFKCPVCIHPLTPADTGIATQGSEALVRQWKAKLEARKNAAVVDTSKADAERHRKDNALSVNWIDVNATKCPDCKVPIQRSEGCDHMTCNQCSCYFCYRCGVRQGECCH